MTTPRVQWRESLQVGVIGGIVAVFIALIGMVEAFAARDIIGDVIDMGHISIFLTFFLSGFLAIRPRAAHLQAPTAAQAMIQSALAGMTSAAFVALLAVALNALPTMRSIFVNATPVLAKLLTFDQDLTTGVIILLVLGAGIGILPGLLQLLPANLRRSLLTAMGWVILIGLLQELLTITFQTSDTMRDVAALFFASSGLSANGAVVLFVLIFAVEFFRLERSAQIQSRVAALPATQRQVLNGVGLVLVLIVLLSLPSVLGLFFSEVLVQVGLFALMGLGLNIVVGLAGLLDLGYVAFFAVGAYTVGVLTSTSTEIAFAGGLSFWTALPLAIVFSLMAGVILGVPVLKVRGDYLAIVTLGFGEIIRLLALSDFLKPYFGGARGLELIPKPFIGSFEFATSKELYYIILAGCLLVAFISMRLKNSRVGRAWMAVREDEDVAQAMGINLVSAKLLAFGMGAAFAGIGGAINASKLAIIYPHSFNVLVSINVLSLIIIGGMGSIPGVIVGALALVGLPELLREVADFRLLLYGALLVFMMLTKPEGLLPEARRRLELEEFKEEEAAAVQPTLVSEPGEVQRVVKTPGP